MLSIILHCTPDKHSPEVSVTKITLIATSMDGLPKEVRNSEALSLAYSNDLILYESHALCTRLATQRLCYITPMEEMTI